MSASSKPSGTGGKRGWEKPTAGSTTTSTNWKSIISKTIDGFSDETKATHRIAFLHLLTSVTGSSVDVEKADGTKIKGIFHAATPFEGMENTVILKTARAVKKSDAGADDYSTMVLDANTVASVQTSKIDLFSKSHAAANGGQFATDSSIKKNGDMSHLEGRKLQSADAWLTAETMTALGNTSPDKQWDQFAVNKQKFGVKSSYDENIYTKKIDMSSMSREQVQKAERQAREIETSFSSNIHLQEERGQVVERETELDEEDLYSGVLSAVPVQKGGNSKKQPTPPGKFGADKTASGPAENAWSRGTKFLHTAAQPSAPPGVPAPAGFGAKAEKGKKGASADKPQAPRVLGTQQGKITPSGVSPTNAGKGDARSGKDKLMSALQGPGEEDFDDSIATSANPLSAPGLPGPAEKTIEAAATSSETTATATALSSASASASADKPAVDAKAESKDNKADSESSAKPKGLNASAKEFKFNPTAGVFKPGGFTPATPPASTAAAAASSSSPSTPLTASPSTMPMTGQPFAQGSQGARMAGGPVMPPAGPGLAGRPGLSPGAQGRVPIAMPNGQLPPNFDNLPPAFWAPYDPNAAMMAGQHPMIQFDRQTAAGAPPSGMYPAAGGFGYPIQSPDVMMMPMPMQGQGNPYVQGMPQFQNGMMAPDGAKQIQMFHPGAIPVPMVEPRMMVAQPFPGAQGYPGGTNPGMYMGPQGQMMSNVPPQYIVAQGGAQGGQGGMSGPNGANGGSGGVVGGHGYNNNNNSNNSNNNNGQQRYGNSNEQNRNSNNRMGNNRGNNSMNNRGNMQGNKGGNYSNNNANNSGGGYMNNSNNNQRNFKHNNAHHNQGGGQSQHHADASAPAADGSAGAGKNGAAPSDNGDSSSAPASASATPKGETTASADA